MQVPNRTSRIDHFPVGWLGLGERNDVAPVAAPKLDDHTAFPTPFRLERFCLDIRLFDADGLADVRQRHDNHPAVRHAHLGHCRVAHQQARRFCHSQDDVHLRIQDAVARPLSNCGAN